MIRVATIIPNYLGGGAETVTDSIVRALKSRGYEFVLITQRVVDGCTNRVAELYSEVIYADFPMAHYSPRITQRLFDVLKPLKCDIAWLIGDEFADIPLLRQALNPGGKVFYHLHSIPFFQVRIKESFPKKRLMNKLFGTYSRRYHGRTEQTVANADAVITLCRGYAEQLRKLYPAHAEKILTINNPLPDVDISATPRKLKDILYLGRLSRADKRLDLLLNIFAKVTPSHPEWRLKIVGDGPERHDLEKLADDLGLGNVEFCGFCADPARYLDSAAILCLTSEIEGWGMVLVEALQHGAAPIAFNCSAGVEEILADGRGILVPPGDVDRYAAELSRLMDSPELRQQLVSASPKFLQSLSITNIAPQWEALFHV